MNRTSVVLGRLLAWGVMAAIGVGLVIPVAIITARVAVAIVLGLWGLALEDFDLGKLMP